MFYKDQNITLRELFDYHVDVSREGKSNDFLRFLYKSRNHYMINLLIASNDFPENGITYETICRLLDNQFADQAYNQSID